MRTALLLLSLTGCSHEVHDDKRFVTLVTRFGDVPELPFEITTWPQPGMAPVPTFDELANEMLVAQTVRDYTDERGTYHSLLYPIPRDNGGADFMHPQHVLREAVQEAWLLRQYPPHTEDAALTIAYSSEWYLDWTAEVRDVVREHLRDPQVLKETYLVYKPIVVPLLVTAKDRKGIVADLKEVERCFALPVSDELRREHEAISAEYEATVDDDSPDWEAFTQLEDQFLLHARDEGFPNTYLLQWRLRREAEGGPELVQAWAEIVYDLGSTVTIMAALQEYAAIIERGNESP